MDVVDLDDETYNHEMVTDESAPNYVTSSTNRNVNATATTNMECEMQQERLHQPGDTLVNLIPLLSLLQATTTSPSPSPESQSNEFQFEDHYSKDEPIRSGSYGRVYKCHHKSTVLDSTSNGTNEMHSNNDMMVEVVTTSSDNTHEPIPSNETDANTNGDNYHYYYAVKELNRSKMKPNDIDNVIREVSILHELSCFNPSTSPTTDGDNGNTSGGSGSGCKYVIQLIDFYVSPTKLYVVQIYAAGGDVFDRITKRKHYTEYDARLLAKDLLCATQYMHQYHPLPIVHRDLKPENLLLLDHTCDTHVVVADFGFARHVDPSDGRCTTRCGTPSYVSPELLLGCRYNGSVDIWSIGCILYMLLAGYPPFTAPDHRTLFRMIRAGDYVFHDEHWSNVTLHAKQLITHLLCVNTDKRYTAEQALNSSWFTSVSDDQLLQQDLSNTIQELKKFDPKNAWKKAFNALGFCSAASFWQPDMISFQQQLELWDNEDTTTGNDQQRKNVRVRFSDVYVLIREIRKGKSGTVWECQHKSTPNTSYAVKIIKRTNRPLDDEIVLNEVTIMQSLAGSHYVVELLDFYEEKDAFYLVMEYCIGGDLFDRVLQFTHYTESDAKDLTVMLLKAIRSIHQAGIAHRDIKPQNVLLLRNDDNVRIRIADFGFARRVHLPESLTHRVGTPSYVAPEILRNLPHDQRVDLWSLGIVVFVLLVGYPPFLENDQTALFNKIRKGEWVFYEEDWKNVSNEAKQFVLGLLVVDPNERWTIDECLRSAWIQQNPHQLSSVNLSVVLSKLREKKNSLRSIARSVMMFNDSARTDSEG